MSICAPLCQTSCPLRTVHSRKNCRNIQRHGKNRRCPWRDHFRNCTTTSKTRENKRGPPSNLRPIVLLILRKILAICMILRTEVKIRENIPVTQAAYQGNRHGKTGDVPEEIILGIVLPLPKPGKTREARPPILDQSSCWYWEKYWLYAWYWELRWKLGKRSP